MIALIILIAVFIILVLALFGLATTENVVLGLSADDIRMLSTREDASSRWLTQRLRKPRELSLFFVVTRTLLIALAALILFLLICSIGGRIPVLVH